jgi:hypothetical protein
MAFGDGPKICPFQPTLVRTVVRNPGEMAESSHDPPNLDLSHDEAFFDRSLEEVLGLELSFAPNDLAPAVDEERLRAFLSHKLSSDAARDVLSLVLRFRTWHEALARAVRQRPISD